MRSVKFLTDAKLADGQIASAGTVHLLNDASAFHHVKRGRAEYVEICKFADQEPEQDSDPTDPEEDSSDGDTVESAPDVEGEDGGDTGERAEPDPVPTFTPAAPRRRSSRRS